MDPKLNRLMSQYQMNKVLPNGMSQSQMDKALAMSGMSGTLMGMLATPPTFQDDKERNSMINKQFRRVKGETVRDIAEITIDHVRVVFPLGPSYDLNIEEIKVCFVYDDMPFQITPQSVHTNSAFINVSLNDDVGAICTLYDLGKYNQGFDATAANPARWRDAAAVAAAAPNAWVHSRDETHRRDVMQALKMSSDNGTLKLKSTDMNSLAQVIDASHLDLKQLHDESKWDEIAALVEKAKEMKKNGWRRRGGKHNRRHKSRKKYMNKHRSASRKHRNRK